MLNVLVWNMFSGKIMSGAIRVHLLVESALNTVVAAQMFCVPLSCGINEED